jgi:DNA modification methylase
MSYELMLGDCREAIDRIPDGVVDVVITDPPYGVGFKGKATKHTGRSGVGYGFDDDVEYMKGCILPVINQCISRFRRVIVTPGVRNLWLYPPPADIGVVFCPSGAGSGKWGFCCAHPILYYGDCPYLRDGRGSRPNSFSSTESAEKNGHPCPKPLGWMRWLVNRASSEGETVLDPFMGSGTTGVACMRDGRKFIGVEIDPRYYAIAERRIRDASFMLF